MNGGKAERLEFAHEAVFGPNGRIDRFDMVAARMHAAAKIEKVASGPSAAGFQYLEQAQRGVGRLATRGHAGVPERICLLWRYSSAAHPQRMPRSR